MLTSPGEVIISTTPVNGPLLLRNARVIRPDRVVPAESVLIENGRIKLLADSVRAASLSAGSTIDCEGLALFPGFIDTHIHGAVGVDTMDATADELRRVSEFLATQGVTAWMPTLVPAPPEQYESAMNKIDEVMSEQRSRPPISPSALVIGVHYEGPFVASAQCGALHSNYFKTYFGPSDVNTLPVTASIEAVRMITVAPEIEGGIELVRELVRRDWIVSIGHTRAAVDVLDSAFLAGARHMTHFMNAMPPFHHRSPGPVGWGLSRDDVSCDLIADGIHLDPLVLRLLLKTKGANRLSLISDAIAAAGKGDGEYQVWEETITVKNGRTGDSRGSIAGSVITMLDAVRMMLSLGASEVEVARMASTNPARLLRIDQDYGSIEEGKRADLVALDGQRNVRLTIVGGVVVL